MAQKAYRGVKTGQYFNLPTNREDALRGRHNRYIDEDGCKQCQEREPGPGGFAPKARFTQSNECFGCSMVRYSAQWSAWLSGQDRPDPFAVTAEQALQRGIEFYYAGPCERGPHMRRLSVMTGRCVDCEPAPAEKSERAKARAAGLRVYLPAEACPECHQVAPRNVTSNACSGCLSPRLVARRESRKYYTPATPCPECGTVAERSVANNTCLGCKVKPAQPRAPGRTPEAVMMRECPDMVLSKEEAELLGLKVYRTGAPCGRGHTGWRYKTTGGCIDCKKAGS